MRYHDVRTRIQSGDLAVVRTGNLIARQGRSDVSHAMLCAWRYGDQNTLTVAESRERVGSRVVTLSSQIRRFGGQIDIYRPKCGWELRQRAATVAFNWAGRSYAYPNIARIALVHRPLLRSLVELIRGAPYDLHDVTPSGWSDPKICSQLVAWAYRWARHEIWHKLSDDDRAWDPVPELGDAWVEPGDLVRSGSFEKLFEGLVIDRNDDLLP